MNKKYQPSASIAWSCLKALSQEHQPAIAELFQKEPRRLQDFSIDACGIHYDFSKSAASKAVLDQLIDLANQSPLFQAIELMFNGERLNLTEGRAVLHTALRGSTGSDLRVDGENVEEFVQQQLHSMKRICDALRDGSWTGCTGKPIRQVVNIGIGGSDLGPRMVCTALREFAHPDIEFHFLSNVDGAEVKQLQRQLDAETTLIIVASKTFTTQETLLNANSLVGWMEQQTGKSRDQLGNQLIGVTASPENAMKWGVPEANLLFFRDWVGGRYSLWSSIGLPIAMCIGFDGFEQLLKGAREMDEHFRTTPWRRNLPVISALLGIWNSNFRNCQSQAIIPYCERLGLLPDYLQQLDMESNGKQTQRDGQPVSCATGAVLWGQTGTNGQHAFFQLLHQGTQAVPVEFIAAREDSLSDPEHHRVLLANMIAQGQALMQGQRSNDPHRSYPGNRPSTTMLLSKLDPYHLGALIAFHEHRVFTQGIIWNINSFDQWGVELGKKIAGQLLAGSDEITDPSTANLVEKAGIHTGK